MAAGVVAGVAKYFKRIPKIIIVEPDRADCVLKSIKNNKITKANIRRIAAHTGAPPKIWTDIYTQ